VTVNDPAEKAPEVTTTVPVVERVPPAVTTTVPPEALPANVPKLSAVPAAMAMGVRTVALAVPVAVAAMALTEKVLSVATTAARREIRLKFFMVNTYFGIIQICSSTTISYKSDANLSQSNYQHQNQLGAGILKKANDDVQLFTQSHRDPHIFRLVS
jgi:hypothetical protein